MIKEKIVEEHTICSAKELSLSTTMDLITEFENKYGVLSDIYISPKYVPECGHGDDRETDYYIFSLKFKRDETDKEMKLRIRFNEAVEARAKAKAKNEQSIRNKYVSKDKP